MSVAVLIPWGGDCVHRRVSLEFVRKWYGRHHPEWEVIEGESPGGADWCKGRAVADALRWTTADVLVIADADSISLDIHEAVRAVQRGRPWAMSHHSVHRLSWAGTMKILNTNQWPSVIPQDRRYYDSPPYAGMAGGGITVVRRDVYLDAPMDHRFIGWGQEDGAWGSALNRLYGLPWRVSRTRLWHLWHPPQRKTARTTGSLSVRELQSQYRSAQTVEEMNAVLDEPRRYVRRVLAGHPKTSV